MKVKATVSVNNEKHELLVDIDDFTASEIYHEVQHKYDKEDISNYLEENEISVSDKELEELANEYRDVRNYDESWYEDVRYVTRNLSNKEV